MRALCTAKPRGRDEVTRESICRAQLGSIFSRKMPRNRYAFAMRKLDMIRKRSSTERFRIVGKTKKKMVPQGTIFFLDLPLPRHEGGITRGGGDYILRGGYFNRGSLINGLFHFSCYAPFLFCFLFLLFLAFFCFFLLMPRGGSASAVGFT